ncbi:MAG: aminotransferase class V-fold PLP-dependent enzyme [Myxococcota bacterium]
MRLLALCVANSARSQMAEGWLRALSIPDVEVYSAGSAPTRPRPEAVAVMREVGIDLAAHRSKSVREVPAPDVAITLCAEEVCPLYPGEVERLSWPIDDPANARGSWEERLAAFRVARDAIRVHVEAFLRERRLRMVFGAEVRDLFALRQDVTFLNHGSFGATPRMVLEAQRRLIDELESQPLAFMRSVPVRIRRVAARVASFLRADPQDVVFVDNASTGVTAVLRSLSLREGDVLFTTDHAYGAVRRALDRVAARTGARVVAAPVPFPIGSPREVIDAVERTMPDDTKLAVFDGITSITGLVFPVEALVGLCRARGIPVLIDAAHVPGHLPVDLGALEADYWVGNCHKWLFAPKGCAVLHVRRDRHEQLDPVVFSHGVGTGLSSAFDWLGTRDPSPWLAMDAALDFVDQFGADRIRAHNVLLRESEAELLCGRFGLTPPAPSSMLGALQTLPVPFPTDGTQATADAINRHLWETHRVEVMFAPFRGRVWMRIAAQIYNRPEDYERLGDLLLTR